MARSSARGQVGAGGPPASGHGARKQSHPTAAEISPSGPAGDLAAAFEASGLGSLLSPGEVTAANVTAAVLTASAETPPAPPEGEPERCEFCGGRPRHGKCASCWGLFCLACCTGEQPIPEGAGGPPPPTPPPAVLGCPDQREDDTCGRALLTRCQAGAPCPPHRLPPMMGLHLGTTPGGGEVRWVGADWLPAAVEALRDSWARWLGHGARQGSFEELAEHARRTVRARYGAAGPVELAAALVIELSPDATVSVGPDRTQPGVFARALVAALVLEVAP